MGPCCLAGGPWKMFAPHPKIASAATGYASLNLPECIPSWPLPMNSSVSFLAEWRHAAARRRRFGGGGGDGRFKQRARLTAVSSPASPTRRGWRTCSGHSSRHSAAAAAGSVSDRRRPDSHMGLSPRSGRAVTVRLSGRRRFSVNCPDQTAPWGSLTVAHDCRYQWHDRCRVNC